MITLQTLTKTELGAELGVLNALEEQKRREGHHFYVNAKIIARAINVSDSTVRRTLKRFVELNIIKINSEIWLNPRVFGGNYFKCRLYDKQVNAAQTPAEA